MKFRCYLLSLLRIHRPDCEHCKAREKCGIEMRERLAELNWRTQPNLLKEEIQREVVEVFDSKPGEVVARTPISLAQQREEGWLEPAERLRLATTEPSLASFCIATLQKSIGSFAAFDRCRL